MRATPYRVYLVVDRHFGGKVQTLVQHGPVWIVSSDDNDPAVHQQWKDAPAASHLEGITLFDGMKLSSEGLALGQVDMIDLHHGEYSADPPYTELEVIGTDATEELVKELRLYGFDRFTATEGGFVATRPLPVPSDQ